MVQKLAVDADDVGQSTYLVHESESRPLGTRFKDGEAGGVIFCRYYISATEAGVWVVVVDILLRCFSLLSYPPAGDDGRDGWREGACDPASDPARVPSSAAHWMKV